MKRGCTPALVFALAMAAPVGAGEAAQKGKMLTREETVELFRKLHAAVPTSRTFQAKLRRTEETDLVVDAEPRVYEGEVAAQRRPYRGREEVTKPHATLKIINEKEVWVYFPEERKAEHIDLAKGIKGREETKGKAFMPWLTFDFDELDRWFKITVRRLKPPKGFVVKKVPTAPPAPPDVAEEAKPVPLPPADLHEIAFVPKRAEYAPNMLRLVLTVYGEQPWPVRIERESEDDLIVTEFTDVILDAPIAEEVFAFRPPGGTKVLDLSR